jgi:BlaI family penicillinase repressor
MARPVHDQLSRLERRIVEALYRLGEASVGDVTRRMAGGAGAGSVRVTLAHLAYRGYVRRRREGRRFVYRPAVPRAEAGRAALRHVVRTYFGGSPGRALGALVDLYLERVPRPERRALAARLERG